MPRLARMLITGGPGIYHVECRGRTSDYKFQVFGLGVRGRAESTVKNRHSVGDASAPHERRSCSIMAPSHARAVARLRVREALTGK